MRSLEYEPTERYPYARIDANLQEAIGQESHRLPSVFSFFRPEYSAAGKISTSGLVAPETQGGFLPLGVITAIENVSNSFLTVGSFFMLVFDFSVEWPHSHLNNQCDAFLSQVWIE